MFKWLAALLVLLLPFGRVNTSDYVGQVAAEAAYSAMLPTSGPAKPKVPTKDCTTCNGTGRVRTGDDNHPWTKCPDCDGSLVAPDTEEKPGTDTPPPHDPDVKIPKSDPSRYSPTPPPAATRLVR